MNLESYITVVLVALSTWLTPTPRHSQGLLVSYGPDYLVEANAEYRGYDLSPYRDRCGVSVISPSDLGKIVWIKTPSGWYGPCLAVDVGARRDFYQLVYINREIAELGNSLRNRLGFENGLWGEIAVSSCPPVHSIALRYQPELKWDNYGYLRWKEWPKQQLPVECNNVKLRRTDRGIKQD